MIYEVILSEIYEVAALTPTDAICKAQAKQAKGEFGDYSTASAEAVKGVKSGCWIVDSNAFSVSCSNCGVSYHPSDLAIVSDDADRVPYCPRCDCRNEGKIR